WQGEYPGPVIDVRSKKKGRTTVQGWMSLRKLTDRRSCTIKNGLYHPWSESAKSLINYYTIAPVEDYVVSKELSGELLESFFNVGADGAEDQVNIKLGDKIINVFYGAEGFSTGTWIQNGKETQVDFYSDAVENAEYFSVIQKTKPLIQGKDEEGTPYEANEQWLYLACKEGYNVFVQDSDILSQKGVKQGTVTGFGEIEGAQ
ncbi:hypothetical protein K2X05_15215, partial [bacterium]|nr:hypothetical protein [bacterium]